jgi:phosphoglycerate kinase
MRLRSRNQGRHRRADDDLILDIGPETAQALAAQLMAGRHHCLERPGGRVRVHRFRERHQGHRAGDCRIDAFSIAGGGDTLAAIAKYGIEKEVGYISTGGGAFLEVLEGKTLPALEILTQRAAG